MSSPDTSSFIIIFIVTLFIEIITVRRLSISKMSITRLVVVPIYISLGVPYSGGAQFFGYFLSIGIH